MYSVTSIALAVPDINISMLLHHQLIKFFSGCAHKESRVDTSIPILSYILVCLQYTEGLMGSNMICHRGECGSDDHVDAGLVV